MASISSSDNDIIAIAITDSDQIGSETAIEEVSISTTQIETWDLPSILRYRRVKVQAHRSRLVEQSSYFHGMLNWSFSESRLDQISIEWDLEAFLNVLKCIYGCPIDITGDNFLAFYEGALYFGVKFLLEKCKTWFSEAASSIVIPQIPLDNLISIWNFGIKSGNDFLLESCGSYLAKNFMWAISRKSFVDIPYSLLVICIRHPHLTMESEMHLCDALLIWLDANTGDSDGLSSTETNYSSILKQIHLSLLPLWFTEGKRRSCHFSKLADESIISVFRLLKVPPTDSIHFLEDGDFKDTRIRLTEHSKTMNLSSCIQITSAMLLLSLLPSTYSTDSKLRKNIKQLLVKLESVDRYLNPVSHGLLPMLSFKAVEEVNISKCGRLHLQASIECFSMSFPSLKILKAAYLLDFNIKTLRLLVQKCPTIREVDLTLDTSPVISEQVSDNFVVTGDKPVAVDKSSIYKSHLMLSNITKLILEGRSELCDSDLLHISKFCIYLQHLNVKGCTGLTDVGISTLIQRQHVTLQSILVCYTSFGLNSVLALCSSSHGTDDTSAHFPESMAFNLQTLHIGGCKCVDETSLLKLLSQTRMLKSLCLGDTHLTDRTLYSLAGSSLEMLDVSNTMVSGAAVAHVVYGNPGLKCLRVKGCRNLCQRESNTGEGEISSYFCGELEMALGKTCRLEELSVGWGFSHFSIEALKAAITSLREITVSLGGSLGEGALIQLPTACPSLQSIVLQFQVISDDIIINIMETLRNLRVLALCYCFGDISILGFKFSMPNLRKLQLERVTPWLTNKDLVILIRSFPNLVELALLGCPHLNSDSQQIISHGWPGLVSIHLEECGEVTANGVSSLLKCVALEDLLLRHNGPGLQKSFICYAASKMPLLRKVSLDFCDASEGCFDVPPDDQKCSLRAVKLARCKSRECGLTLPFLEPRRKPVHKETLVLEWTGKNVIKKVAKERL
ncbi:BTB/POZ domain-containing protein FBL11 [Morus notabilis]|uniref:BTB/POZ domain-containing protein FBL11 n=1 Tax=Morus notabilis TaxID=981085 RepID=UPI000CECF560|nr:BTB/POZ domain-containing protein FBL11 [Morus notabilis]